MLTYTAKPTDAVTNKDVFVAKILVDPLNPTFQECRDDNNASEEAKAACDSVQ